MENSAGQANGDNEDLNVEEDLSVELYEADIDDEDQDAGLEQYDNSCVEFLAHKGSVFVVDVDKNGKYIASGGEDDKAFVWELETEKIILEIEGKDSVTCACFSADSAMIALGDMSGAIQVWDVQAKKKVFDFQTADLEWLAWHPVAAVLMAGTSDGDSWLWNVHSGEHKTFQSPGCKCTCGKILPDGRSAVLAYGDGAARIFDLKTQENIHTISKGKDAHRDGVNHITSSGDGQTIITGSLDGSTKLISASTGKVSATYRDREQRNLGEEVNNSIEHVGYSESLSFVATVSLNGYLTVWDVTSGMVRARCKHPDGVTRLLWDSKGLSVFTGCLDGICRRWNVRSGQVISVFVGHKDEIYDLSLSKDDRWLVSASADGSVRVYDTMALTTD